MRSQITAIFLTAIILIQPAHIAGVFIRFKINQDFYARVLCINKEKPELKCHGKCQLKKQLKSTQQKNQADKNLAIENLNIFLLFKPMVNLKIELLPEKHHKYPAFWMCNFLPACAMPVFHPPQNS